MLGEKKLIFRVSFSLNWIYQKYDFFLGKRFKGTEISFFSMSEPDAYGLSEIQRPYMKTALYIMKHQLNGISKPRERNKRDLFYSKVLSLSFKELDYPVTRSWYQRGYCLSAYTDVFKSKYYRSSNVDDVASTFREKYPQDFLKMVSVIRKYAQIILPLMDADYEFLKKFYGHYCPKELAGIYLAKDSLETSNRFWISSVEKNTRYFETNTINLVNDLNLYQNGALDFIESTDFIDREVKDDISVIICSYVSVLQSVIRKVKQRWDKGDLLKSSEKLDLRSFILFSYIQIWNDTIANLISIKTVEGDTKDDWIAKRHKQINKSIRLFEKWYGEQLSILQSKNLVESIEEVDALIEHCGIDELSLLEEITI